MRGILFAIAAVLVIVWLLFGVLHVLGHIVAFGFHMAGMAINALLILAIVLFVVGWLKGRSNSA